MQKVTKRQSGMPILIPDKTKFEMNSILKKQVFHTDENQCTRNI